MATFVKVISDEISNLGTRIVKILRYGLDDKQTAVQVAAPGVDASPIKDMIAVYAPTAEKGQTAIVGYINKNQIAEAGEHRIFSQNADGEVQFAIHLKADGTAEVGGADDNMVRFSKLQEAFNQLKSDHNDLVNAFNAHMHPTAGTGPPSPPTPGTGIPAQPSTADISPAKIDEIKTL